MKKCFLCLVKRDNVQKMLNGEISFFEQGRGGLFCDDQLQRHSFESLYNWLIQQAQIAVQSLETDVVVFLLVVPDNVSQLTREVVSANIDTLKILVDLTKTGEFLNEGVVTRLQNWLSQTNCTRINPESLNVVETAVGGFTGYTELIDNPPILNAYAYNVSNKRSGSEQEDETLGVEHANKVLKF